MNNMSDGDALVFRIIGRRAEDLRKHSAYTAAWTHSLLREKEKNGNAHHSVDAKQLAELLYPGAGMHYDTIAALADPSSTLFWNTLRDAMNISTAATDVTLPSMELSL